mmetsp:Transcript_37976/g.125276  ORF Transcript_37976/g.125276 Transcript_37976/m.125276 type:complete len:277 (+) Transcript_37976:864-1694(+)
MLRRSSPRRRQSWRGRERRRRRRGRGQRSWRLSGRSRRRHAHAERRTRRQHERRALRRQRRRWRRRRRWQRLNLVPQLLDEGGHRDARRARAGDGVQHCAHLLAAQPAGAHRQPAPVRQPAHLLLRHQDQLQLRRVGETARLLRRAFRPGGGLREHLFPVELRAGVRLLVCLALLLLLSPRLFALRGRSLARSHRLPPCRLRPPRHRRALRPRRLEQVSEPDQAHLCGATEAWRRRLIEVHGCHPLVLGLQVCVAQQRQRRVARLDQLGRRRLARD